MRGLERRDIASGVAAVGSGQPGEHRRAARYTLLIRTAKLICPQGEFLCVVRDASETGISVRIFHPLPFVNQGQDSAATSIVLELPNGDQHEMQQVWEEQDIAGFRFDRPANITRLVESPSPFSKRPVRINLSASANIQAGPETHDAAMLNISQQGAQIQCEAFLAIDQRVQLKADIMPQITAKIRWRRDGVYGLIFENVFQFGDFARIVAGLQFGPALTIP